MLYLTFITVGDVPKGPLQEIANGFKKQLAAFVRLDHRVVKDAETILDRIPTGDRVVVLDERGQLVTTRQAAAILKQAEDQGEHLTVILGGPKGLPENVKARANVLLALSPMTTTHDLAHLFFLEQLYRISTINHEKEYHY